MVWVSNTDWKGHISKTIEVVVCVFYSEFNSVLFYNWEWREGKKIDLCKPQVRAVLHTQVDAVIYVLSSLKMIKCIIFWLDNQSSRRSCVRHALEEFWPAAAISRANLQRETNVRGMKT